MKKTLKAVLLVFTLLSSLPNTSALQAKTEESWFKRKVYGAGKRLAAFPRAVQERWKRASVKERIAAVATGIVLVGGSLYWATRGPGEPERGPTEDEAARRIQALWRGYRGRTTAAELRAERKDAEDLAAEVRERYLQVKAWQGLPGYSFKRPVLQKFTQIKDEEERIDYVLNNLEQFLKELEMEAGEEESKRRHAEHLTRAKQGEWEAFKELNEAEQLKVLGKMKQAPFMRRDAKGTTPIEVLASQATQEEVEALSNLVYNTLYDKKRNYQLKFMKKR